jgi:resuscitation-promoting factor RpfA
LLVLGAATALDWIRRIVLLAALGCGCAMLGRTAVREAVRLWAARFDLRFDDLVLLCALGVLAVAAGWLFLAALLTLTARGLHCTHTAFGRLALRITPSALRALLGGACGAAVLVAPAAAVPAIAAATASSSPAPNEHAGWRTPACAGRECPTLLAGLPVPDRPLGPAVDVRPPDNAADRRPRLEPVRPGDSLWAIAARHLPPHATDTDIATAWPLWFDTNRARIGPDPHLIHPRTRLAVPRRYR